jgi:hypothetical protein
MPLELAQIAAREKEIAEQIERLTNEANELAIARRVFEKYSGEPTPHALLINGKKIELKGGQPRPAGAPTTFEMAELALQAAEADGKDGLTAKELLDAIRTKFWPGVVSLQIMPSIYGFVKDKRLRKTDGGKFKRIKQPSVAEQK